MPSPKPKDGIPPANEWGKLRSYLAQQGISQAQIKEAVGGSVAGRKRGEICEMLRAWLKARPRASG